MINSLDLNADDLGLLDVETLNDTDWLLSAEKPDLTTSFPTEEWLQQDYEKPELLSVKWSLIYALDIARNRNIWNTHVSSPTRSPGSKTLHTPYIPGNSSSKDLTDIQILARMQEENLRESTLQRRRRTNSLMPQVTTVRSGENCISESRNNFTNAFSNACHAQSPLMNGFPDSNVYYNTNGIENGASYSSDESPERFRGRNYADQGTFRVKRRTPDKIKRPVIEPPSHYVQSQLVEEEEIESAEQIVLPTPVVPPIPVIEHREVVCKNSQMITDLRKSEVINGRNLPNRPEVRSSRKGLSNNEHASKANVLTSASQSGAKETLEKPVPYRNRSIPRNRTGIPVMSAAKHVSPNARVPASNNANTDKTDLSARRRNSSGAVISTTALKRFNNSNTLSSKSARNMPISSSSHNLKLSPANNGKGLSNNHEEFY